jgi:NADPH:quinone reductase-like Zn-dependent oxidoreductase
MTIGGVACLRAAVVEQIGGTPRFGAFPEPQARVGEVIVDVTLGGLNPVDRLRADGYLDPATPFVAGWEGVGRLGERRVYWGAPAEPYGSFAERAAVRSDDLLDIPDGLNDELAVSFGVAGLSAWLPLTYETQLRGGERVLVTGATGMVGQIATQAAKLLGAGHVVAAGRHVPTLTSLLERGADEITVLDDDPTRALTAVAGDGFDVVIDCVFGAPFVAALGCAAPGATVVVVGLTAGTEAMIDFYALYGRRVISHAAPQVPAAERQAALNTLAEHALAGRLHIDYERYTLDDIEEAWAELLRGAHRKLLIKP